MDTGKIVYSEDATILIVSPLCFMLKSDNMVFQLISDIGVASDNSETLDPGSDDLFSRQVTEEQIQQVFKQIPFAVVAPVFGAAITALLIFDYVEPVRIYTWFTLV